VLSAGDDARRRVVRDVHNGAQQRLVHTIVTLKRAQRALHEEGQRVESLLAAALDHAEQGNSTVAVANRTVRVEVRDDGIRGTNPEGRGLQGMADRVAALRGCLHIDTSRAGGNRVAAELPLPA
jgi:signal transduction histidine kinase